MASSAATSPIALESQASSSNQNPLAPSAIGLTQGNILGTASVKSLASVEHTSAIPLPPEPLLPRVDGGKDAWLFLLGCFIFEALVWGFPFSFGVFQSYYETHTPFSQYSDGIAAIGTCATGIMYLWAPVSLYILEAFPSFRRKSSIFGLVIVLASLFASSYATKFWQLILTQGVLYAIGGSFLYAPTMFYLDEWFVEKKGLAFGIMWAGVGTSGVIFPFLLTFLLDHYGHATTLRIWVLALLVTCSPLIYYVKPRLPLPSPAPPRTSPSYAFFLRRTHICLQISNILESLGFFLPAIFLPTYVASRHLPSALGPALLAVLNTSSVIGTISFGYMCDRLPVTTVVGISSLGATLAVALLWGLGTTTGPLFVFAVTYGIFAGGYSAIWSGMMKAVRKEDSRAGMGPLMGLFAAGRGVGAVASGPISAVLLRMGGTRGGIGAYSTKFGAMVVFTAASAFAGGVVAFGTGTGRRKPERDTEIELGEVGDQLD